MSYPDPHWSSGQRQRSTSPTLAACVCTSCGSGSHTHHKASHTKTKRIKRALIEGSKREGQKKKKERVFLRSPRKKPRGNWRSEDWSSQRKSHLREGCSVQIHCYQAGQTWWLFCCGITRRIFRSQGRRKKKSNGHFFFSSFSFSFSSKTNTALFSTQRRLTLQVVSLTSWKQAQSPW